MIVSETTLEVRYYETDLMGIVHHSNYIRYFECGRHQLLIDIGIPINKIEEAGIMMPVTTVTCNYKIPAKMGDMLRIITT
ncbi:MAG: thioesterase family protein, partial [Bacteroidales bacterium]